MTEFYMIPEYKDLWGSEQYAKEQGVLFEYNDFFHPEVLENAVAVEERIRAYCDMSRDRSRDTMHGAFFDVTVFSYDEKIREISFFRMQQSMEIANRLGLRAVIFHGNYLPFLKGGYYDENWLKRTEEAVRRLAGEFPETDIYIENMFEDSPELLGKLAERLQDVPSFGICLDYAHALLCSDSGEVWFASLSPYIRHIHVNDHCFTGDVHFVPGDGMTDWKLFSRLKELYAPKATVLCEVSGLDAAKRGIAFLKKYL